MAVILLTIIMFSSFKDGSRKITTVDINIEVQGDQSLINKSDLLRFLYSKMDTLISYDVNDVELHTIENILEQNSHVKKAETYFDRLGNVKMEVVLKTPVLRILENKGRGYYLSKEGDVIDWSPNFTPRLIVASGDIPNLSKKDSYIDSTLLSAHKNLTYVINSINSSSYLQSMVDEIVYNSENSIEIVSKIGSARVLLGDTTSLVEKLERFRLFYIEAYPRVGWDKYKEIDVRFKDKVYCRK
jgi:cell division protein FtsQ